ncbi:MAG: phosphatase PAP2 family protein [Bacteroidota bacterium]
MRRTLPYFCWLFLVLPATLLAQFTPTYQPAKGPTAELLTIGGTITLGSMIADRKVKPLSLAELGALDDSKIWGIDRYSLRNYSLRADEWTDKLLVAAFVSPFFNLLGKSGRDNFGDVSLVMLEGALLNSALVNLSKTWARRPRPFNYNPDVPLAAKQKKSARYSFFSGHAATSAYFAFTSAKLYNDLYPDSSAKPLVWTAAALIPTFVSYGRMKAGKHFFTDVFTGMLVGTTIAILVPELNKF